jgi:CDP-diacylglycerol pyrophosphatase
MGIIMRFRRQKIAWTADIEKAFLQIEIHQDHEQMVRFLWVENPLDHESKIIHYRWKRLPFGLTSSPFILRAVLIKHLRQYEDKHPGITDELLNQIYVDDWMGGAQDPATAATNIRTADKILRDAKMVLSKYTTGTEELQQLLQGQIKFSNSPSKLAIHEVYDTPIKKH